MMTSPKIRSDLWEFIHYSVLHDPGSLFAYCHRRVLLQLRYPEPEMMAVRKINSVNFPFDFHYGPMMEWMYYGIYQFPISVMMKKLLKYGDIFIDAGANVGYFSAFALDIVGKKGEVHSFEPVPEYFRYLLKVRDLNPEYHLTIQNVALGKAPGRMRMSINSENFGGNTLIRQLLEESLIKGHIEVPVMRLDTYIQEHVNGRIGLIKIDVEGFEYPLLMGLKTYLEEASNLPPIICEIIPKAFPILGTSLSELAQYMSEYSYRPRLVSNPIKHVDIPALDTATDVLFLPTQ